jgi:hypothetical protein
VKFIIIDLMAANKTGDGWKISLREKCLMKERVIVILREGYN